MSYEPTEDDIRKMREALAKAGAAARALVRIKLDAIEKAAREGTLDDYLEQHGVKEFLERLRGKCAKFGTPESYREAETFFGQLTAGGRLGPHASSLAKPA